MVAVLGSWAIGGLLVECRVDQTRFDALIRALSAAGTRRGLLGLLVALPGLGGLTETVAAGDVHEAGRRKRRKKRHKHGDGRDHGKQKQPCQPESHAKTCAGTCGAVTNNCQQPVDCGPCSCAPACPACQTCDAVAGQCLPDPAQEGQECGAGQTCRADGRCRCDASSCDTCEICQEDGACSAPCSGEGCCAGDHCEPGDSIDACGIDGGTCQVCAKDERCWKGRCVCGDVCAGGCQFATIQDAIDAAESGATIRLCAETYPRTIHVTKSLTLLGVGDGEEGTVIDAQAHGTASAVYISRDAVVTLQGLRITGGAQLHDTDDGGGIDNFGTLTLIECTVTGNHAAGDGGGLYNRGETITLRNSHVTNNRADIGGGGIYGAGYILHDCEVSGNTAGSRGGGILAQGIVELIDTEVQGNLAERNHGGGIYSSAVLRLTNCHVHGNTAVGRGGGIDNDGGELTLEQSQVTDNAAQEGGGIYFKKYPNAGSVTLTDTTIEDNTPDNCAGEPVADCRG
jgi:predicted outer membrane repeat protein